jgi:hypothetical protein
MSTHDQIFSKYVLSKRGNLRSIPTLHRFQWSIGSNWQRDCFLKLFLSLIGRICYLHNVLITIVAEVWTINMFAKQRHLLFAGRRARFMMVEMCPIVTQSSRSFTHFYTLLHISPKPTQCATLRIQPTNVQSTVQKFPRENRV